MIILSHRGYWVKLHEKNTLTAFNRSFQCGFGIETDIRDINGVLIISHDMPSSNSLLTVEEVFDLYKRLGNNLPLALNIKADGLQKLLKKQLKQFEITNYFVFDMSVPDCLGYLKEEYPIFTRQSEHEPTPTCYQQASGVWLDEFKEHWITPQTIEGHLNSGKKVCIVSPELHGRNYLSEWTDYKTLSQRQDLMICTDYPEQANHFFNEIIMSRRSQTLND